MEIDLRVLLLDDDSFKELDDRSQRNPFFGVDDDSSALDTGDVIPIHVVGQAYVATTSLTSLAPEHSPSLLKSLTVSIVAGTNDARCPARLRLGGLREQVGERQVFTKGHYVTKGDNA